MQLRAVWLVSLAACAGSYGGAQATGPHAGGRAGSGSAAAAIDLDAAALPYAIVDARTGGAVDTARFWTQLAGARAICVGEEHSNPHHHWVELEVARHVFPAWRGHAALGLEMVQRPFQRVLDDFAAHQIDEAALLSRTGWDDRWGYDFGFYRPTIAAALAANGALLALNAPKELTKQVAHHGLASLPADDKAQLPELDLRDAKHRAWFESMMEDMGGSEGHAHAAAAGSGDGSASSSSSGSSDADAAPMGMPSAEDIYTVQVIWDETMADTAARWLASHPDGHVVILAGSGHCHDSAIVARMKRRGVANVVSIRSIVDAGEGDVADAIAGTSINDYLVVLTPPKGASATEGADRSGR